ncbi:MAG: alpha/beta fold hydrolase [Roseobacter sp.]
MRVGTQGSGTPVFFVPGGNQTAAAYSQQFTLLSDRFRCISYDPRSASQTTAPAAPWSMADCARDCAAAIDAFAGAQATVFGLSLGGLSHSTPPLIFPTKYSAPSP